MIFYPIYKKLGHKFLYLVALWMVMHVPGISYAQCPPSPPAQKAENYIGPSIGELFFNFDLSNPDNNNYRWYKEATGGSPVDDGDGDPTTYTTPQPVTQTDSIYVSRYNSSCPAGQQESNRVPYVINIDPVPYPDQQGVFTYGDGKWNVYCFNDLNYSVYSGYYIDTNDDINSTDMWGSDMSSPNNAKSISSYVGGLINTDNFSIRYMKKNFTPGIYTLDVDHDDDCKLLIDGKVVFQHNGYDLGKHKKIWTGFLGATSTVEFRWRDYSAKSFGNLTFQPYTGPHSITGGYIYGAQTICANTTGTPLSSGIKIIPFKDTYITNAAPNKNSGTETGIKPLTKPGSTVPSDSIYSFGLIGYDITNVSSNIHSAKIMMWSNSLVTGPPNINVKFYPINNTSWDEYKVTWNDLASLDTGNVMYTNFINNDTLTPVIVDITDYVIAQKNNGKNAVSFLVRNSGGYPYGLFFFSKESPSSVDYYKPYLIINEARETNCSIKNYQWQKQDNCTGNFVNIPSANTSSYTPQNLTNKTCFRMQVANACADTVYSDTATVDVPIPALPIISDTTICPYVTTLLKISGTAPTYNWYGMASGNNLLTSGTSYNTPGLSKDTTYYVSGIDRNCESNRMPFKISLLPKSVAGSVSVKNLILCGDAANKDTLLLKGYKGTILNYLSSNDQFKNNSTVVASAVDSFEIQNLTETTYYKAIVKNGVCPADTSSAFKLQVNKSNPGSVGVIQMNNKVGILNLNGYTGNVVRWESSADRFTTIKTINNTSDNLSINNSAPLYFRAVVQIAGCEEHASDSIEAGLLKLYPTVSPNGDGINDTWMIDNIEETPKNKVSIFNRWGDKVFEIEGYNNKDRVWDGTCVEGLVVGSKELPAGTYFYQIVLNEEKPISGYIIINK